jgi:Lipocalin-like domain
MNSSWDDDRQEKPKNESSTLRCLRSGGGNCPIAQSQTANAGAQPSARERLIGAWHLARIENPGPDGKPSAVPPPVGMLIYTRDGHMSVQLMYPKSANAISNEYVLNGYEASFGSYEVDEATHTLTHHAQGSNTGDLLVGKDLPRIFQFTEDGRLVIRSARSDEHWSVIWEHY